jgi:putative ABC transport system permease protein
MVSRISILSSDEPIIAIMIQQYVLTALRFFRKKWALTALSIVIFGVGIAASILILQKVSYEFSYDRFHSNHQNIYRVVHDHYYPYDVYQSSTATSFYPLGHELKDQHPEVKEFAKVSFKQKNSTIRVGDENFREDDVYVINPSFFKVFTVELISGDTVNIGRYDAFLSESLAQTLFKEDPVGQTIDLWDGNILTVKGVFKDVPENAHFRYDLLAVTLHNRERDNWQNYSYYNYILLNDGVDGEAFEEKLIPFSEKFSKVSDAQSKVDYRWDLKLQPLAGIYLESDMDFEHEINGDWQSVTLLIVMAVFIIIVSCFNFVNLTNAMYAKRFSEFFLRKVHGASLANLIKQHAFESAFLLVIGFCAAFILLGSLPYFSKYSVDLHSQTGFFYGGLLCILLLSLVLTVVFPASTFALINPLKLPKDRMLQIH